MFSTSDTIVAIATPSGRGAIGVVRLSGPEALRIGGLLVARNRPLTPRRATFATLDTGRLRDRVVITAFPAPASYTGEDVVEVSAHGSRVVLEAIVQGAIAAGARLAAPGEFTLRAFLNGKIDLPQAEAVADLIDAVTPLQARVAFDQLNGSLTAAIAAIHSELFDLIARLEASVDFPDEGYHFVDPGSVAAAIGRVIGHVDNLLSSARRGRLVREGLQVAIVGAPNVGKSSLFNALVGAHRAIVTNVAGTTRDVLAEVVDLEGLRVTVVDTAGIVETDDPVEREGVARARQALETADVVLLVCDGSRPLAETVDPSLHGGWQNLADDQNVLPFGVPAHAVMSTEFTAMGEHEPTGQRAAQSATRRVILVSSKADLPAAWHHPDAIRVCAVTGEGLEALVARLHSLAQGEELRDVPGISNVRHIELMTRARTALGEAHAAVVASGGALPEEFVLADLQRAQRLLEEVVGRRTSDDLLVHVFQRFCVGK